MLLSRTTRSVRLHVQPTLDELFATHRELSVRMILSDRFARLVDEGVAIRTAKLVIADSSRCIRRRSAV